MHRAAGGTEALALLKKITPTLVITDLAMPRPDGWDVLPCIRAIPALAHVPVVAITAYYSDRVIRQASQVGFNALIPKPIKFNALINRLQEVVG